MSKTKEYNFEVYSMGIVHASVCTNLPKAEIAKYIGEHEPAGEKLAWEVSDEDFQDGTPNGSDCPDTKGNKHWLMVC